MSMVNGVDFYTKITKFKLDLAILKIMEQMCLYSAKRKKRVTIIQSCGRNQTLQMYPL